MVFTKEQKREWNKRPDVKQRQQEHTDNYYRILAAAHGVSMKVAKASGITHSTRSLVLYIAGHERKALKRRKKGTVVGRAKHPYMRCVCRLCDETRYVYLSSHATPTCRKCRDKERNHRQRHRTASNKAAKDRDRYRTREHVAINAKIKASLLKSTSTGKWFKWLGYTYEEFKGHVIQLLPAGCTWEDIARGGTGKLQLGSSLPVGNTEDHVWERWQLNNLVVSLSGLHSGQRVRKRLGIDGKAKQCKRCVQCGLIYQPKVERIDAANTCSSQCYQKHLRQKQYKMRGEHVCVECGTSLEGRPRQTRRCDPCALDRIQKRQRIRYAKK